MPNKLQHLQWKDQSKDAGQVKDAQRGVKRDLNTTGIKQGQAVGRGRREWGKSVLEAKVYNRIQCLRWRRRRTVTISMAFGKPTAVLVLPAQRSEKSQHQSCSIQLRFYLTLYFRPTSTLCKVISKLILQNIYRRTGDGIQIMSSVLN